MSGADRDDPAFGAIGRRTVILGALTAPMIGAMAASGNATSPTDPIVQTRHGPVRGLRAEGLLIFKGLRYGADTRPQRFSRPVPPTPWREPLNAQTYGPACPQHGSGEAQSEDCLFLNLWTPDTHPGAKRPVMVYIHGGAYHSGSGADPLYEGSHLAAKGDVVVITLNHRLNAFGYLYLPRLMGPAFSDSGNAGMWDLILALKWIADNVEAFGGDPRRVMLFGQSGGGAKIASLMAAPAAKGLFHAAATMSGQQVTASGPLHATARAEAFLKAAGLNAGDPQVLLEAPAGRLVDALTAADPINPARGLYFGPVLDEQFLHRHPFWPDAPAQSASVPMILGNTKDETRNLIGARDASVFELDWASLPARLAAEMRADLSPELVVARYRQLYPTYRPADVLFAATTASRSWRGQVEEADARARQGAPTWVYRMDWPSPLDGGKWGAPHMIDIALAFGNLTSPGALAGASASARRVSDQLGQAFISLARRGNPNHHGLPEWLPHRLPERLTMVFDRESRLLADPRGDERRLFAKVPFIQWGS